MQKAIWIDTDLSVGMKRHTRPGFCDVDDGFAILQLLNSDKVAVKGLSAVFGNTTVDNAYMLCEKVCTEFASYPIPFFKGASEKLSLQNIESNEAVEALADALKKQKMCIMAIGPATNIALLLLLYPELSTQIEEVVLVAGRRKSSDYFSIGKQGRRAKDMNFDFDNDAFRIMMERGVKLVFCPFEISNKVWISSQDLDFLAEGNKGFQWLAKESRAWLKQWVDQGESGFNPFDVLASHYIIAPEDIIFEKLNARLEIHPDDTLYQENSKAFKHYLLCDDKLGFSIYYCFDVVENYKEKLLKSLSSNQHIKHKIQ